VFIVEFLVSTLRVYCAILRQICEHQKQKRKCKLCGPLYTPRPRQKPQTGKNRYTCAQTMFPPSQPSKELYSSNLVALRMFVEKTLWKMHTHAHTPTPWHPQQNMPPYLLQQRLWTSNKNAWIPPWPMGCRNRWIPEHHKILPESRSIEMQHWAIILGTKVSVLRISKNLDTNLCWQKTNFFVNTGLYPNYLKSSKQINNLVPRIIAQCWISILRDSGRILWCSVIQRFRHPIAHCGIHAFLFEVDRAPCTSRMLSTWMSLVFCWFCFCCTFQISL